MISDFPKLDGHAIVFVEAELTAMQFHLKRQRKQIVKL